MCFIFLQTYSWGLQVYHDLTSVVFIFKHLGEVVTGHFWARTHKSAAECCTKKKADGWREIFFFFALTAFPSLSGRCSSSKDPGYFRRLGAYMKLTFITCMTSRGPMASGSYLMWALLVARATEQYRTPLVFMRVDSILCTQEAQVIPLTCKRKVPSC